MHIISAAVLVFPAALARSQQTFTFSTTVVDVLSNDPNYTLLLRLLQRARFIPTLNRLNGCTFFAPTNDAIKKHDFWPIFLSEPDYLDENIQDELRQQLFYHLLNYTAPELPPNEIPVVHKTLHYPKAPEEPPLDAPPPWIPIPGGRLGGEPQRLRASTVKKSSFVGVDAFGKNGFAILNRSQAGNGVIFGVSDVLEPPGDLAYVISRQPSLSYFHKILGPDMNRVLNFSTAVTAFFPINAAWDALGPYERLYLESPYASDDLELIFNMHAVLEGGVKYSDSFDHANNLTTISGTQLQIHHSSQATTISGSKLIEPDIYASNGVIHLVDSLLVPPDALQLTPEKFLLSLNCTTFVSLVHAANLTYLINNTAVRHTILAPSDDVFLLSHRDALPKSKADLRQLLRYHFIPDLWTPERLEDDMLLETELVEGGLGGGRQVLSVGVSAHFRGKEVDKSITFGGAGTIGDPIEVNNTLVYFLSRPLLPPMDALQTALPNLDLSSFLAAVFSTTQAETLKNTPRTSLLIPKNSAFKRLGMLVSAHLLGTTAKQDLESVILHHTLRTVEYSESLRNGSQHTFGTLEGSDVQFSRMSDGTLYANPSGGWSGMKAEVYEENILTQTGVMHEISDILLPRSVELTIGKLARAAQGNKMLAMSVKAGFEWVLNGTAPPEGSQWANDRLTGAGWTLLCPTDDAFKNINWTKTSADIEILRPLIAQHLIPSPPVPGAASPVGILGEECPNNNRPLLFDNSPTYSTLLSRSSVYGDLRFRWRDDIEPKGYFVGISGVRGTDGTTDWARVLSWGRSISAGGGGVIQIDRLLVPYNPSWWIADGAPAGVGLVGCLIICAFFYGVRIIWIKDTTEATYEPVGGFGLDDE